LRLLCDILEGDIGNPRCRSRGERYVCARFVPSLGRVLAGLAQAPKLASTTIIAVEDETNASVRQMAARVGAKLTSRAAYLQSPTLADAIMVVNTLHHMPFRDVAAQLSRLLRALKLNGVLLIHDMAELREPEQGNVPWRMEDILLLVQHPALEPNPRATVSRGKKVPISNVLVRVIDQTALADLESRLAANAVRVWELMKRRTLERIQEIFARREPDDEPELQYELIANANLDLNRP